MTTKGKVIGIQSLRSRRHSTVPVKFLRRADAEPSEDGTPHFYVKILGMNDRVEINKATYDEVIELLKQV